VLTVEFDLAPNLLEGTGDVGLTARFDATVITPKNPAMLRRLVLVDVLVTNDVDAHTITNEGSVARLGAIQLDIDRGSIKRHRIDAVAHPKLTEGVSQRLKALRTQSLIFKPLPLLIADQHMRMLSRSNANVPVSLLRLLCRIGKAVMGMPPRDANRLGALDAVIAGVNFTKFEHGSDGDQSRPGHVRALLANKPTDGCTTELLECSYDDSSILHESQVVLSGIVLRHPVDPVQQPVPPGDDLPVQPALAVVALLS
jgi:hypothetical protein